MKILKPFDYLYYVTFYTYKNVFGDSTPHIYAVGLVSLMQQFNIFTLIFILITKYNVDVSGVSKGLQYASFFIFLIPNHIRYMRFLKYPELSKKWQNDTKRVRWTKRIFSLAYVLASFIIFIATAVIMGKINRGEL